jgi:DNA-binding NtrC family response regulator
MRKAKILVVDDEVEFASALAERLQLRGYDTKAVFRGEDTLAIAKSAPPDIILLDLKMPGMNGIEVLMTIRQFAPDIEVILLTGHIDLRERIEGMRIDDFNYIMKPVDMAELLEKIEKAIEKHR